VAYRKCKLFGHKWDTQNPYKQYCQRKNCIAHRVLMADKITFETTWKVYEIYEIINMKF
jgi:Prophage protein (DUF1660)